MERSQASKTVFTIARILIGVVLLWYLARSGAIDWSSVARLFRAWPLALAAFGFLLVDLVVTAYRLCILMRPRGFHLSVWNSTRLTLIGNFFNTCLPGSTGGDVVRIYYATQGNQGRRTEVATIMLLDRAVGMFALLLWPLVASLFFPSLIARLPMLQALLAGAGLVAAAMLIGFLIARSAWARRNAFVEWTLAKMPFHEHARRILDTVHAYRHDSGALMAATGVSLVAHSMSTGITMLCAHAMNPESFAAEMAVLIPIGHFANVVPLTPGGLGVGEAAFDRLFRIAGLAGGAEAMIGWRLLGVLAGVVGLFFYLRGRRQFVHAQRASASSAGDSEFHQ